MSRIIVLGFLLCLCYNCLLVSHKTPFSYAFILYIITLIYCIWNTKIYAAHKIALPKFSCINTISKFIKSYLKNRKYISHLPFPVKKSYYFLSLPCYLSGIFFYILFRWIPILSHFLRLSTHGYCVKATVKVPVGNYFVEQTVTIDLTVTVK